MGKQLPTLVTFSGSGGTGKTSVVNLLASRLEGVGDGVEVHRSIVREFYTSRGVTDEASFLSMPPQDRRYFQLDLLRHYMQALKECLTSTRKGTVLCERSVFDHIAYTLYGTRELFAPEDARVLSECRGEFINLNPYVFYLPYPTPWDASAADGFRAREVAKDTLVDAMIFKQLSNTRKVWCGTLVFSSVKDRVHQVLCNMYPNVKAAKEEVE